MSHSLVDSGVVDNPGTETGRSPHVRAAMRLARRLTSADQAADLVTSALALTRLDLGDYDSGQGIRLLAAVRREHARREEATPQG